MKNSISAKEQLIEEILDVEWDMFSNVRSRSPVSCQQNQAAFRLHRGAQFSVWSEDTLRSYLDDLSTAKKQGSNLMTLKYARMEDLVPILNANPIIDEIVQMETEAQNIMILHYPDILQYGRPLDDDSTQTTSFKTYLRGELETYSDRTLMLLHRDITQTRNRGENWVELLYSKLFKSIGYNSLDEVSKGMRKK